MFDKRKSVPFLINGSTLVLQAWKLADHF